MDDEPGHSLIGVSSATLFGDPLGLRKKNESNASRRGNHLPAQQTKTKNKWIKQQRALDNEILSSEVITLPGHEESILREDVHTSRVAVRTEKEVPWYRRWFEGDSISCCYLRDKHAPQRDAADRPTVRTAPQTNRDAPSNVSAAVSPGSSTGQREDDRPPAKSHHSSLGLRQDIVDDWLPAASHNFSVGLRNEGTSLPMPQHSVPESRENGMPLALSSTMASRGSPTLGHANPREQEKIIQSAMQDGSSSQKARTQPAKNAEVNEISVFKWPRWALDTQNPKIEVYVEEGVRREWVSGTPQQQVAAPDGKLFLSVAYEWDGDLFEEDFSPSRVRAIGSTKSLHAEANFLRQMNSTTLVDSGAGVRPIFGDDTLKEVPYDSRL